MDRNLISLRQSAVLKLAVLRLYFDFCEGMSTAKSVADKHLCSSQ